jgi:DNA polymerase/3'-5' exonuclease PolX
MAKEHVDSSSSLEIIRIKDTKWRSHTYFRWNGSKEFVIKNYANNKKFICSQKGFYFKRLYIKYGD